MLDELIGLLVRGVLWVVGGIVRVVGAILLNWLFDILIEFLWPIITWPFRWVWSRRDYVTRWFQGG